MTAFDFLKWCFSDFSHGLWTVIVGGGACEGLATLLRAARGKAE